MVTRRTMVAGAPLAAGLVSGAAAQTAGAPAATGARPTGFHRYKVGDIEVTAINVGFANRPIEGLIRNAELADVKKALADAFLPENTLPITFTTLVVRSGGKTALIDTGFGDNGPPTTAGWEPNFKAAGFDRDGIDTVIISHFHGDHISGLRMKDGTAGFAKAEVMVPEAEWAFWTDEGKASAAPEGLKPNFALVKRVFGPMMKDVKTYAAGKELVPGVTAIAAPGHTPGHTAYMVSSGNAKLMIVSDITNHPALFVRNPTWSAVFDMDADQARATRIRMLDMAAAERTQVAFYHAPFPATGHIAKDGAGFTFVPVQYTPPV